MSTKKTTKTQEAAKTQEGEKTQEAAKTQEAVKTAKERKIIENENNNAAAVCATAAEKDVAIAAKNAQSAPADILKTAKNTLSAYVKVLLISAKAVNDTTEEGVITIDGVAKNVVDNLLAATGFVINPQNPVNKTVKGLVKRITEKYPYKTPENQCVTPKTYWRGELAGHAQHIVKWATANAVDIVSAVCSHYRAGIAQGVIVDPHPLAGDEEIRPLYIVTEECTHGITHISSTTACSLAACKLAEKAKLADQATKAEKTASKKRTKAAAIIVTEDQTTAVI